MIGGRQLLAHGALGDVLEAEHQLDEAELLSAMHYGHQQTLVHTYCHSEVDVVVQLDLRAVGRERSVDIGMIHQRAHHGDGDDVRDRELLPRLLLDGLEELLAELGSLVHVDLVVQHEGRGGEVAVAHALGDDATHHIHRYDLDTTFGGCRRRSCRSSGSPGLGRSSCRTSLSSRGSSREGIGDLLKVGRIAITQCRSYVRTADLATEARPLDGGSIQTKDFCDLLC